MSFTKAVPGTWYLLKNGTDQIELCNSYSLYLRAKGKICLHTSPTRKISGEKLRFYKIKLFFFTLMDCFILDMSGRVPREQTTLGLFSSLLFKRLCFYLRHRHSELTHHRLPLQCSPFPHLQNKHHKPCPKYLLGFPACEKVLCCKISMQSYR